MSMMMEDETPGDSICRGLSTSVIVAAVVAIVAGAVFGGIVLFNNYERTFARLAATDIRLGQELYNESVSRKTKDTLLEQQIAQLTIDLNTEAVIREQEYLYLLYAIDNETQTRIANELIIEWLIGNETNAREAIDSVFASNITTLFSTVNTTELYQIFSETTFAQLLVNVSFLEGLLTSDAAQRAGNDTMLFSETTQQNQTLAYLATAIVSEIHNRTVFENLLFQTLAVVNMNINTSAAVKSINGQGPTPNGNLDIVSSNSRTVVTNNTAGNVVLTNTGVFTINSIAPNPATGDIAFIAGNNIGIDTVGVPANTWRVSYTGPAAIALNIAIDTNTGGIVMSPPSVAAKTWTYFFTMSVPAGPGTWACEIHTSLVLDFQGGHGLNVVMQLAYMDGSSSTSCGVVAPETGACLTLVDSVYIPVFSQVQDAILRTLLILPGGSYSFFYASDLNSNAVGGSAYTITLSQID